MTTPVRPGEPSALIDGGIGDSQSDGVRPGNAAVRSQARTNSEWPSSRMGE